MEFDTDDAESTATVSLILIVEDDEKNMRLARDVLQSNGYATLEAITGENGVQLARERKPDLVLMDIQLPGINGIEALRQLRADPQTAKIPVIAFTASVMHSDRAQFTAVGFDAFISKPVSLRDFLDTVKRLLPAPAK